ncbi:MAG TPA: nitroreductase family protein [Terriglobales bacterium]|nr:nitroreductase family protein [Terriglobales bacterium]
MDFFETVERRQSVRAFASTPLPEQQLQAILEATNRAPSAGNFQSFQIYRVDDHEKRVALTAATFGQNFVVQAPVSLVFCADPSRCEYEPGDLYALEDATIACTFAMLAATAVGLSTCWIGAFKPESVAEVIGAPNGQTPVAILPIGYAAETPERTSRRQLSDLIRTV